MTWRRAWRRSVLSCAVRPKVLASSAARACWCQAATVATAAGSQVGGFGSVHAAASRAVIACTGLRDAAGGVGCRVVGVVSWVWVTSVTSLVSEDGRPYRMGLRPADAVGCSPAGRTGHGRVGAASRGEATGRGQRCGAGEGRGRVAVEGAMFT